MNLLETLKAIRARIDSPEKWTNKTDFCKADHSHCYGVNAERFSLSGAIRYQELTPSLSWEDRDKIDSALHKAAQDLGAAEDCPLMTVMAYSYSTGVDHADVMQLLDRAIKNAEPKESYWHVTAFTGPSVVKAKTRIEATAAILAELDVELEEVIR
jgi:hypothetical protein